MYSDTLKDWAADGHFFKTGPFDLRVFYKDYGNPEATPAQTLLLIHGFPESSFSFHKVIGGLSDIFDRIVLFDLPGFGLSDKPDEEKYTYSLF
ncbi:MAG: alpha/beta fold hydrolase, partial [Bacteroidetes bacterium]